MTKTNFDSLNDYEYVLISLLDCDRIKTKYDIENFYNVFGFIDMLFNKIKNTVGLTDVQLIELQKCLKELDRCAVGKNKPSDEFSKRFLEIFKNKINKLTILLALKDERQNQLEFERFYNSY